ncbi:Hypothetical protein HVR_LOCUS1119 [uncultured virus]|nr:Hypothetical protein HVR_LOCUS1119 [uncultured virus]
MQVSSDYKGNDIILPAAMYDQLKVYPLSETTASLLPEESEMAVSSSIIKSIPDPDPKCIKKNIPSATTISSGGCVTTITGNLKEVRIPSITTIVSEIKCTGSEHGKVERHDFTSTGVPPNNKSDILILTSGVVKESGQMFLQRAARADMWFIYISITVIDILVILSVIFGISSTWYKNIRKSGVNPWLIGALWIVATIFSYAAIFMLWVNIDTRTASDAVWEHANPEDIPLDLRLSIYFLIGSFLSLLWTTVLFQGNNIGLAVWIAALLFLYQFWLLIYIWIIKIQAAIFMIPLVIMYGYLFYATVHLASINKVSL